MALELGTSSLRNEGMRYPHIPSSWNFPEKGTRFIQLRVNDRAGYLALERNSTFPHGKEEKEKVEYVFDKTGNVSIQRRMRADSTLISVKMGDNKIPYFYHQLIRKDPQSGTIREIERTIDAYARVRDFVTYPTPNQSIARIRYEGSNLNALILGGHYSYVDKVTIPMLAVRRMPNTDRLSPMRFAISGMEESRPFTDTTLVVEEQEDMLVADMTFLEGRKILSAPLTIDAQQELANAEIPTTYSHSEKLRVNWQNIPPINIHYEQISPNDVLLRKKTNDGWVRMLHLPEIANPTAKEDMNNTGNKEQISDPFDYLIEEAIIVPVGSFAPVPLLALPSKAQ